MADQLPLLSVLHNMLKDSDLPFPDFMEVALYYPEFGYYARRAERVGREGDFITSPSLSPVFSFVLGKLIREFLSRLTDGMTSVVDMGCGDGSLIHSLYDVGPVSIYGVDRFPPPGCVSDARQLPASDYRIAICNELFDALPFARLVQREEHLHELWVTEREGRLDWSEHEAEFKYDDYFAGRGIELADGQFADVSLEWEAMCDDICRFVGRGLILVFDYGYPQADLFSSRTRRFGTAAAYRHHRVSRDLLADPGEQDLTAHINFTDLQRAGARNGFTTLFFDRQAKFLLAAGATEHELFKPLDEIVGGDPLRVREAREDARRLVLPDGIGEDIRVLVMGKGVAVEGWAFQRKLF